MKTRSCLGMMVGIWGFGLGMACDFAHAAEVKGGLTSAAEVVGAIGEQGWRLVGDARRIGGGTQRPGVTNDWQVDGDRSRLRLTPARAHQVGGAWLEAPVSFHDSFDVRFGFVITQRGGASDFSGKNGADGFAFVVQAQGKDALGVGAGGLGYYGIRQSLAVEFDTWKNAPFYGDPDGHHISIQTRGSGENRPEHELASLAQTGRRGRAGVGGQTGGLRDFSDGKVHEARVVYRSGRLDIYLDDDRSPRLSVPIDLPSLLGAERGWMGFTASTGGAWENHDIVTFSRRP